MGFSLKGIIPTGRFVMNVIAEAAQQLTQYTRDTVLLLKGEGSNNQTNNVFIDSSSNNLPITRAGNVTQGSFTPFSRSEGSWGVAFNGTNDYMTVPASADFSFTGDYTIEAWCNIPNDKQFTLVDTTGAGGLAQISRIGSVTGIYHGSATPWPVALPSSGWFHMAFARQGTNLRMFVNGALIDTRPTSGTIGSATNALNIGRRIDGNYYLDGAISNLRIVKGTAVYTAAFTPSTEPLTAVPGTVLLTAQSRRFQDNSIANRVITPVNAPKVTAQSPFAFTEYNTATIGGSAYFDAVDDYLNIPSITLPGEFTLQAWVYIVPKVSTQYIVLFGGTTNHQFALNQASTGISMHDGSVTTYSSAGVMNKNEWNHVAWSRSGTTVRMFINGKQVATTTSNANILITRIGQYYTGGYNMPGYVADAEITSTALYTADFTPPTAPRSAPVASTRLLLKCTNAGIVDSSGMNTWETIGSTKVSTVQKKFGTSAIAFNGTTDYIKAPTAQGNFAFGTGDFTVEGWIYRNNVSTDAAVIAIDQAITTGPNTFYIMYWTSIDATKLSVVTAGSFGTGALKSSIATQANTWHHFAVTRQNGLVRIFMDGVLGASATLPTFDIKNGNSLQIGAHNGSYRFNGYIDDLRITKGQALYTANFTPPGAL